MDNSRTNPSGRSHESNQAGMGSQPGEMAGRGTMNEESLRSSQLMKLFQDELKDIYWAEKALTKAVPKMIKNASSSELVDALTSHLAETENQVNRIVQVFGAIDQRATSKHCPAMEGLITEAEEIIDECEAGPMRDAGIISAVQKVEHYEIATYGTLRQIARTLKLDEAAKLLQATLDEEKAADKRLSQIAIDVVNMRASQETKS